MKNMFYAVLLCFLTLPAWAGVGKHNLLVNFTVGPSIFPDPSAINDLNEDNVGVGLGSVVNVKNTRAIALMGLEIGYLLHSVRASGTIHGLDLRLGIWGDLPTSGYSDAFSRYKNPVIFNVAINYTPGIQFKKMRLLFDVIGINIASSFAKVEDITTGGKGTAYFPAFIWTLPLGSHFILNNGVYFGIRHHIVLNAFARSSTVSFFKYSLMFNIGYAFGGGK